MKRILYALRDRFTSLRWIILFILGVVAYTQIRRIHAPHSVAATAAIVGVCVVLVALMVWIAHRLDR